MPFDFPVDAINSAASSWALAMQAALVQGTLALIVVTLLRLLLRRHTSHAFAHGLFLLVPVKSIAAAFFVAWPVVIAFSMPVPAFIYKYTGQRTEIRDSKLNNASIVSATSANPSPEIPYQFNDKLIPEPDKSVPLADKFQSSQIPDPVQRSSFQRISKTSLLMIAWLATVLILAMLLFINHLRMMRRLIRLKYEPDPEFFDLVRQMAAEFSLRGVPTVWPTTAVNAPAVIGLLQPKLLLPVSFFTDLPSNEIRWAILHELAHLKRRDLWWLAFERAIGLALFFHPALWLACRATRHFRELACDDLAQMQSGLSPRECAQAFLNIIAWSGRNPSSQTFNPQPLGLMDRYSVIQQRIMNMTESDKKLISSRLSRKAVITIAFLAIVATLPFSPKIVAMPQPPEVQQKPEPKKQSAIDNLSAASKVQSGGKVNDEKKYSDNADYEKLKKQLDSTLPGVDSVKPSLMPSIPNDPPPHEGAMFEYPAIVNVPDVVLLEVMKSLPGKPIGGEYIVGTDGMVNLLHYGKLHVAGLTTEQIKLKLILHLRKYLSDELLGLIVESDNGGWEIVEPVNSMSVAVAIASTRSQFYYLQGEIQSPGRFQDTGKMTIIDAITEAGGLKCNPDNARIVLIRPAIGNKNPVRFQVDWNDIFVDGQTKQNLQLFPGDRLLVEKKEVAGN